MAAEGLAARVALTTMLVPVAIATQRRRAFQGYVACTRRLFRCSPRRYSGPAEY